MKIDKFGNAIYEDKDLVEIIYSDKEHLLEKIYTENIKDFKNLPTKKINPDIYNISIKEFDQVCQNEWFMPDEYKNFNIVEFVLNQTTNEEQYQRTVEELTEYENRNMLNLLRWLKYIVDTCRLNNIVWGVGRGSSVSSYVLYLLGVHRIDSVKYDLDWKEFLR
jgi:DNA polymerase III alpha subunit